MKLGIDFDNTLVLYDNLFYELAMKKNLIREETSRNKRVIRDYLRSRGKDEEFTILQSEVYGLKIKEAQVAPGQLRH